MDSAPGDKGNAARCWGPSQEANSRLVSAAPELLESVKMLLVLANIYSTAKDCECLQFMDHGKCPHARARAAIAKAEGKP